jgi:hypothetical protein
VVRTRRAAPDRRRDVVGEVKNDVRFMTDQDERGLPVGLDLKQEVEHGCHPGIEEPLRAGG